MKGEIIVKVELTEDAKKILNDAQDLLKVQMDKVFDDARVRGIINREQYVQLLDLAGIPRFNGVDECPPWCNKACCDGSQ